MSLLAFAVSGWAQQLAPKYQFFTYGVKRVSDCAAPLGSLQDELRTIGFPDGWRFIVVCRPLSWDFARKVAGVPTADSAFTDRSHRSTTLDAAIFHSTRTRYRQVLLHELGHVTCDCNDEAKAEKFARSSRAITIPARDSGTEHAASGQ